VIPTKSELSKSQNWGPAALQNLRDALRRHQDAVAPQRSKWIRSNNYFYDRLKRVLRFIVPPQKRVLEVRCQTGHFLASVDPSYGVGIEISNAMIECARQEHPQFSYVCCDPEEFDLGETFDFIIFDHIFDTVDILTAFDRIRRHCSPFSQLIVINFNHLWEPILKLASQFGLRSKFVEPNWVSENDIRGFLSLAGFRPVRKYRLLLFPKWIPLISAFVNDFLARLPGLRRLCMMQVMVARPICTGTNEEDVSVSVIVPCRNEAGNVKLGVERIPVMGKHSEIIFCDDKSTDTTAEEVRRMQQLYPEKNIRLVHGPGICKAENVWTGFRAARGDVLMILDADLTVMPEELPMFLRGLIGGNGRFVNGSRLVYPMPHEAMKISNMIGNKIFGLLFSYLLDHRIKDTLCGTKVLWRRDWLDMEPQLGSWGISDLWGDYELLFGASKLHLEIVEVPVHYQERIYGMTKMTRVIGNGWRMLRFCWHAWLRLGG
jgi:ubiquinone/menaquinone biosynthesis C-methylase UbiE